MLRRRPARTLVASMAGLAAVVPAQGQHTPALQALRAARIADLNATPDEQLFAVSRVPRELLVQFHRPPVDDALAWRKTVQQAGRAIRSSGAVPVRLIEQARSVIRGRPAARRGPLFLVEVPVGVSEAHVRRRLLRDPGVEFVDVNGVGEIAALPDDPAFPMQWYLWNVHQATCNDRRWLAGVDIGAVAAWDIRSRAPGVLIAVTDTGVDRDHPDLAGNLEVGRDFIEEGDDDIPEDGNGHGTHVAGVAGARGNNGLGVAGVAWEVRMLPLQVCTASGACPVSAIVEAFDYAIDSGAHIVNASWIRRRWDQALFDRVSDLRAAGVLLCAAVGNEHLDLEEHPRYPASFPHDNILAVAATDGFGQLAGFSNYGAVSADLAAPGVGVLSTYLEGGTACLDGTSMATPMVAAAAALVWDTWRARGCDVSYAPVRSLVMATTSPNGWLTGRTVSGGELDLRRALLAAEAYPCHLPGDFDSDADVDSADFLHLAECFGPPGQRVSEACLDADLDLDGDCDLVDFSTFAAVFTGP